MYFFLILQLSAVISNQNKSCPAVKEQICPHRSRTSSGTSWSTLSPALPVSSILKGCSSFYSATKHFLKMWQTLCRCDKLKQKKTEAEQCDIQFCLINEEVFVLDSFYPRIGLCFIMTEIRNKSCTSSTSALVHFRTSLVPFVCSEEHFQETSDTARVNKHTCSPFPIAAKVLESTYSRSSDAYN